MSAARYLPAQRVFSQQISNHGAACDLPQAPQLCHQVQCHEDPANSWCCLASEVKFGPPLAERKLALCWPPICRWQVDGAVQAEKALTPEMRSDWSAAARGESNLLFHVAFWFSAFSHEQYIHEGCCCSCQQGALRSSVTSGFLSVTKPSTVLMEVTWHTALSGKGTQPRPQISQVGSM